MIARFSLYGFLKNQRYFEPFLMLAFLDVGLGFGQIGLLFGAREVTVGALEIVTGSIADVYGRRLSMILSFVAYIVSFAVFATGAGFWAFLPAMVLFGIGDAFRSGTHKAMILTWLRAEGREDERVEVYGYTRSWSKTGSAVSVPIGTAILLAGLGYRWVFWLSILPYVANVANLGTYPAYLDGAPHGRSVRAVFTHLAASLREAWARVPLRRLLLESWTMGGLFKAVKDYVQPTASALAAALPVLLWLDGEARTAVLVGLAYVLLYVLEATASRRAAAVARRAGGPDGTARALWWAALAVVLGLTASFATGLPGGAVLGFLALAAVFNLYRPVLVSRLDAVSDPDQSATVLSLESQGRALVTLVLAPLIGHAVDLATGAGEPALWPVGAIGVAVVLVGMALMPRPVADAQTPA